MNTVNTNTLKLAIIGSGYWGKNLVRVFSELGALHTVCDSDGEKLEAFKTKYHSQRANIKL